MTPLPRGRCSVCRGNVPVRVNGDAREHISYDINRPAFKCKGSGKPVEIDRFAIEDLGRG